jgi:hypothetical protein
VCGQLAVSAAPDEAVLVVVGDSLDFFVVDSLDFAPSPLVLVDEPFDAAGLVAVDDVRLSVA